jgi:hypothetical protein
MSSKIYITLAVGCGLAVAVGLHAQQPAPTQQPARTQQPAAKPASAANPFPEDTSSVPVVPISREPAAAPASAPTGGEGSGSTSLLKNDSDPAHSPDDPVPDSSADSGFSSSLTGSNDINIPDEPKQPGKHGKANAPTEVVHQETAKEDENVG